MDMEKITKCWKKIKNINWEKTVPFILIGIGILILSIKELNLEATLIVGVLTFIGSMMTISATIKDSSKNTFINTITIARKEYMITLRKAVTEFCVAAERNDNDKLKELSYQLKLLMNPADKNNEYWDRKAIEMIDKILQAEDKVKDIDEFVALMQSWLALEWRGITEESIGGRLNENRKIELRNNFSSENINSIKQKDNGQE